MTVPLNIPDDKRIKSHKRVYKKNSMAVNVEEYCYLAFGVNIMAIPSISHSTALTILSEPGPDFVSKFPTAKRQSAMTLSRSKDALGAYYRRVKARTGGIQANVAAAHRLAVIIYNMVKNGTEYDESKVSKPSLTMLEKRRSKLLHQ